MREADRDPTEAAKSSEELLNKVKDYAGRSKLDSLRISCNLEVTLRTLEPLEGMAGRSRTATRMAFTRSGSRARGRAKEAKAKESATTAEPQGISLSPENAQTPTRAKAKAKNFKENATIAERRAIRLASAPRTKELGATDDAE